MAQRLTSFSIDLEEPKGEETYPNQDIIEELDEVAAALEYLASNLCSSKYSDWPMMKLKGMKKHERLDDERSA